MRMSINTYEQYPKLSRQSPLKIPAAPSMRNPFRPLSRTTRTRLDEFVVEQFVMELGDELLLGGVHFVPFLLLPKDCPNLILVARHTLRRLPLFGEEFVEHLAPSVTTAVDTRGLGESFDDPFDSRDFCDVGDCVAESFVHSANLLSSSLLTRRKIS